MIIQEGGKFKVQSHSDPKHFYMVEKKEEEWVCTCPAFQEWRKGVQCKHIIEAKMFLGK